MEDRLSNLTIDAPSTGVIPDGNNLAHFLSQVQGDLLYSMYKNMTN